jgi:hypothetical protein
MAEFYKRLEERLRSDVAELLPEESLKALVKRAVEESFFKKRQVNTGNKYNPQWEERPSEFEELIVKAAQPTIDRLVAEIVAQRHEEIIAAVNEALGDNVVAVRIGTSIAAVIETSVFNFIDALKYSGR